MGSSGAVWTRSSLTRCSLTRSCNETDDKEDVCCLFFVLHYFAHQRKSKDKTKTETKQRKDKTKANTKTSQSTEATLVSIDVAPSF